MHTVEMDHNYCMYGGSTMFFFNVMKALIWQLKFLLKIKIITWYNNYNIFREHLFWFPSGEVWAVQLQASLLLYCIQMKESNKQI